MNSAFCKGSLAISAMALLAGCATPDLRYNDLFFGFTRMGLPAKRVERLPAFLVDGETGEPVPGARLIVDASPEPVVFEGDDAGQVLIRHDGALARKNPPVRAEPGNVVLKMGFTATLDGRLKSVQLRSVSGMMRYGDARVAVFHREGDEMLARGAHAELARCRAGVKSILGLEPNRMAVILEPARKEENVLYVAVSAPGYDATWLCFGEKWDTGEFMSITAHEWAESTLVSSLSLYDDPRNRFVGDGLAEFVVWKLYGLPDDYLDRLAPALIGGVDTVDLLSAFQTVPFSVWHRRKMSRGMKEHGYAPGYALSFAFWHELSEKHGSGLPSKFVKEWVRRQATSADEAIAILVRLTGDETVGDKVRSADVDAARSRIERLIR